MLWRSLLTLLLTIAAAVVAVPNALAAPPPHGALAAPAGDGVCFAFTAAGDCKTAELSKPKGSVVSPDGRHVYTLSSNGVHGYSRAADGRLTPMAGPGSCVGQEAKTACAVTHDYVGGGAAIAASPDGRSLYVTIPGGDTVLTIARDPQAGTISVPPGQCQTTQMAIPCPAPPALDDPVALVVAPDGRFVYVGTRNGASVITLERDTTTGALTPLTGAGACVQAVPAGDCAKLANVEQIASLALTPDGRHLYAASPPAEGVFGIDVDPATGRLTPMTGDRRCVQDSLVSGACARWAVGLKRASAVAVIGGGTALAAAGEQSRRITVMGIDPDGGLAVADCIGGPQLPGCEAGTKAPLGEQVPALAATPDGRSLLVPDAFGVHSFRTHGGSIDPHPSPARCVADTLYVPDACDAAATHLAGAQHVAVSPDGSSAYVTAGASEALRLLRVEAAPVCATTPLALATTVGAAVTGTAACDDPNGDPVTHLVESRPQHGTAAYAADGAVTYTPAPGFLGADAFLLSATDGTNFADVRQVTVNVTAAPAPAGPGAPTGPPAPAGGNGKAAGQDGGRGPTTRAAARKATLTLAGALVARGASVRLPFACATARCTGVVRVTAQRRTLASAKVDLAAGQRTTVTARLTRAGRRALRARRTVGAKLTFLPAGTSRPAFTRTVTLKRG